MSEKHVSVFVQTVPVLASLLVGVLCALLISSLELYSITPFPEGAGSFGNALYFVALVGFGATVFYFLLKRRNIKIMTLLIGFALTSAVFMLSLIYSLAAFSLIDFAYTDLAALILSGIVTVAADVAIFRKHVNARNLTVVCLGGALGTFLGTAIPTLSTFLILAFLALYDIFAVYRGPVGKIAHAGLDQLRGLSFSFRDIQMGLGDLTFYSMLSGHMLLNFGHVPCAAAIAGILTGCVLSFKMLEKKGMFPGLPFPILLGLTAGLLASAATGMFPAAA